MKETGLHMYRLTPNLAPKLEFGREVGCQGGVVYRQNSISVKQLNPSINYIIQTFIVGGDNI